jgi:3-hydroxyacyl-[acyl-carrier-protein] dehydratase
VEKNYSPSDFLPHAYPFVMIDRIVEYEEGKRVVCLKNVTLNEEFFHGHFSNDPVMPWSLILEAMAQTAGLLLSRECSKAFIAQMTSVKIHGNVVPGDCLYITAVKRGVIGAAHSCIVKSEVNGEPKVEGVLMLAEIPKDMEN